MAPTKDPRKSKKSSAGKDMAAGAKSKKGKGAATKGGDGAKSDQMSPKEMKSQMETLRAEKSKEEQERNYVQLERDKVASFLEIKNKELEQARVELLIKDRSLEEQEERHQDEIKVFNQKMKHLMYEQHNTIATIKVEYEVTLKLQREQAAKREAELLNEQLGLKEKLRELELAYEETMKQLKLDHGKELTKMKQEYDVSAKELQAKTDKKDKHSLQQARASLLDNSKQLKNLEFEKSALQQSLDEVKQERDELYKQFEDGMFKIQQKCDLKNLLIHRKVQVLAENLEKKDAQLGEIALMTNRDTNVLQGVNKNINHVVDLKNKEIKHLNYEMYKIKKAYKDLSNAFKTKLVEFGIPLEEMGLPYYSLIK